jgi:hypothetical protein
LGRGETAVTIALTHLVDLLLVLTNHRDQLLFAGRNVRPAS